MRNKRVACVNLFVVWWRHMASIVIIHWLGNVIVCRLVSAKLLLESMTTIGEVHYKSCLKISSAKYRPFCWGYNETIVIFCKRMRYVMAQSHWHYYKKFILKREILTYFVMCQELHISNRLMGMYVFCLIGYLSRCRIWEQRVFNQRLYMSVLLIDWLASVVGKNAPKQDRAFCQ